MSKNKKNTSASKKLLPAIAMFTTSAILLSTSTYAWFTLNKEVEVTGLRMAAVAGDSLEITLGALKMDTKQASNKSNAEPNNTTYGSIEDLGWSRSEVIDNYYKTIGKLKPASSADALTLYKVDEDEVYAGGQAVDANAEVKAVALNGTAGDSTNKMATLELESGDTKYGAENLGTGAKGDEGYYVDIPMWIRSNYSKKAQNVNAWVKITDPKNDTNNSDLINAVRVALIPVASTDKLKEDAKKIIEVSNTSTLKYEELATRKVDNNVATNATIFGLTADTYNSKVIDKVSNNKKYSESLSTNNPTIAQAVDTFTNDENVFEPKYNKDDQAGTPIFQMPAAANDDYAAVLVVARIWIEGESTHCNDATANQDWSIDFHFEFADDTSSGTSGESTSDPSPGP